MKPPAPHLFPASLALLVLGAVLLAGDHYVTVLDRRFIHAFASSPSSQARQGIALQKVSFQQPGLLPVYGSSELIKLKTPYSALKFFDGAPTGFQVIEFARGGATSLDIAQDIASLGPDIRGKKVVISFTPSMFIDSAVAPGYYAGDFSLLHANGLVFSPYLSMDLKRQVAARMLEYPATLQKDDLLRFALNSLAAHTPADDFLYSLALPLGELNTTVIRAQDEWEMLSTIASLPPSNPTVQSHPRSIDWKAVAALATAEAKIASSSNPYGVDNALWAWKYPYFHPRPPGSGDRRFLAHLAASKEWDDFNILLEVLHELGAQPLILSRPLNGPLYEAEGVSKEARAVYYARLEQAAQAYGFPVVDFKEHDLDPLFSIDIDSHTSHKGWVYVDQSLDNFYHDRQP